MKTENKEFFIDNVEAANTGEEEIVLAPPAELLDEAKEIAQSTKSEEKYPFTLHFDANQKDFLLSMLQTVDAIVETENAEAHTLNTWMNMAQLALIKRLDCIERVQTEERLNPFLAEEAKKSAPARQEQPAVAEAAAQAADAAQPEAEAAQAVPATAAVQADAASEAAEVSDEPAAAPASIARASACSNCPTNTDMESAQEITAERYISGCICCPGTEQWFKFTPTESKTYTIRTTGELDTQGYLYSCCTSLVEFNDDFAGKVNFRIVQYLTAGKTYYIRVRARGNQIGSYTLNVTDRIFASYVTINKKPITLEKGVLYELPITPNYTYKGFNGAQRIPGLSVSIYPYNVDNNLVWWWVTSDILDARYGWDDDGDRYIHLIASENGTATLRAEDWAGNGRRDECTVYIGGAPVTGISLGRSSKIISLGDSERLYATVYPSNAMNKEVIWSSSNWGVVDVDQTGLITGYATGTATVTATTVDGNYSASCVVDVDAREKVSIVKDGNYFDITFKDGKVWKSVGCDLTLEENRSGIPMWNPDNIDLLNVPEQRYMSNHPNEYTAKQLAFAYLCDPWGVEYYLREYNTVTHDTTLGHLLRLRDNVFKEIFGCWPRLIKIFPNNSVSYYTYNPSMSDSFREDFYSDAEILFGDHTIVDTLSILSLAYNVLNGIVISLLSMAVPQFGTFMAAMDLTKFLFYNAAVEDTLSSGSSALLSEYVGNVIQSSTTNDAVRKGLSKRFGWVSFVLDLIPTILESASVFTPSLDDIRVYNKINAEYFRASFIVDDAEMSMQEFLDHCEL